MEDATSKTEYDATPVLSSWNTSIPASVLGATVGWLALVIVSLLIGTIASILVQIATGDSYYGQSTVAAYFVSIIFNAAGIIYARGFYPSYFTDTPMARKPKVISFLNLAFGGLLFGSWWNHNLTKGDIGTSHNVLTALNVLVIFVNATSLF